MHVRELAADALRWLIDNRLLPAYRESGRFAESFHGDPTLNLARGQQVLVHYAALEGPLYQSDADWRRAMLAIDAFVSQRRARARSDWQPLAQTSLVTDAEPKIVLDALESAFRKVRLAVADRSDLKAEIVLAAEDACTLVELPEPYGKWFQHRERRARWDETRTLRLEVRAAVVRNRQAAAGSPSSQIRLAFSAPAPHELREVLDDLRRVDRLRLRNELPDGRVLDEVLKASSRAWLQQLR